MEEKIKAFARSLGAVACGITKAENNSDSVIVCLFPYFGEHNGNLSLHAVGRDYHKVVGEKLEKLKKFLLGSFPDATISTQVDIGEYTEKMYAQKSGVGFLGKNNLIIHDRAGTFTFIGMVRINQPLAPDSPNEKTCMGCNACIKACPGGALTEDGFCEARCASFISQKRGELDADEIETLQKSGLIWGCDICQKVCPHNRGILPGIADFRVLHKDTLTAQELEHLSNREFSEKFGEFSFAYRGKNVLLRNIEILEDKKTD